MNKAEKILKNLDLIEYLVENFKTYYTKDISVEKIITFLYQFKGAEEVGFVLKLLSTIRFLSQEKILHLLLTIVSECKEEIDNKNSKFLISSLGQGQDSASIFTYDLGKELFDSEQDSLDSLCTVTNLGIYLQQKKPSFLIFFDDNITSGIQLKQFFTELLEETDKPEIIRFPLSEVQIDQLKKCKIFLCFAIQLAQECEDIICEIENKYQLNIELKAGVKDFTNYLDYSSPIVTSIEESKKIKKMVSRISRSLYMDKKWGKHKVYERLYGFGNLGKLTVFEHNIPKSLIPIFWKTGIYKDKRWLPLFPERSEYKKLDDFHFDQIRKSIDSLKKELIDNNPSLSRKEELIKEKIDDTDFWSIQESGNSIILKSNNLCCAILQMRPLTEIERSSSNEYQITSISDLKKGVYNFKKNVNSKFQSILDLERRNRFSQYMYFLKGEGIVSHSISSKFIDDSDLRGDYTLFIFYTVNERDEMTPLYSARSFADEIDISNEISVTERIKKPESFEESLLTKQMQNVSNLKDGLDMENTFVMDRLAGRSSYGFNYIKYLIFRLVYSYNLKSGRTTIVGLARKSPYERLLCQYLNLGFVLKGLTYYNIGTTEKIPHWVIYSDLNSIGERSRQQRSNNIVIEPRRIR
ncbi:hypothetical protein FEE95_00200 [Maribacter algarum]|uniref:PRTase-CE domain-containing protein n=1 Tax=Maribacter algarum (ex Zhang et al. 2020) TaxID=2578118 RepID=A0A5S3PSB8_9FLAO|nr:hypothetical protein [Maribacter algarum]TMM57889.1 hypothetical protein FEE95_00200 [Maribacter algarum]